jgi:hypothetical protein
MNSGNNAGEVLRVASCPRLLEGKLTAGARFAFADLEEFVMEDGERKGEEECHKQRAGR